MQQPELDNVSRFYPVAIAARCIYRPAWRPASYIPLHRCGLYGLWKYTVSQRIRTGNCGGTWGKKDRSERGKAEWVTVPLFLISNQNNSQLFLTGSGN
jgi:hypothetical protein